MEEPRLDKTAFSVVKGFDNTADKEYWWSKTPEERFEYVEYFRTLNSGQDILESRIQRVHEIIKKNKNN